jgi:tetratricopeptide (TPR) repeat protein
MTLVTFTIKNDVKSLGTPQAAQMQLYVRAVLGMADLHRNTGAYGVAIQMLDELKQTVDDSLLPEDPLVADYLCSVASLAKLKGNHEEAKELFERAMDVRLVNFGRTHPKTAAVMTHLGHVELTLCNFTAAHQRFDEAFNINRKTFESCSPNHPALAASYYATGLLQHRLSKLEDAADLVTTSLAMRTAVFHESHTSVAQSRLALANIQKDQYDIDGAMSNYEAALTIRREAFQTNAAQHSHLALALAGVATGLQCKGFVSEAVLLFEEAVAAKEEQMNALELNYSDELADLMLMHSACLLAYGRVTDAALLAGKCGVHMYQIFKSEAHLRVGDCLFHLANASKALGRFKDAKYQFSVAFAIRLKCLGNDHLDVWAIVHGASDNMRQVGYYHDAFEAVNALENFVAQRYPHNSNPGLECVTSILHANLFADKGKAILSEPLLEAALLTAEQLFGPRSLPALHCKIGLGKAFLYQNKLTKSEENFEAALEHAQLVLDAKSPVLYDVLSELAWLKYFQRKPVEHTLALATLKNDILPMFVAEFGMTHPLSAHTKGRIGLFMNKAKRDSGKKQVFDALKVLDQYKQYPFAFDQPWVLELGGFEKQTSKDRISAKIEEFSIAPWAVPSYEGDTNYGVPPKHIWVDLKNYAPESWGLVMYYGVEKGATKAPEENAPTSTPFERIRTSKKKLRSKKGGEAEAMVEDLAPPVNYMKSNETELLMKVEAALVAETTQRKELEEKLEVETAARAEAEDNYMMEQKEKEMLEADLLKKEIEIEAMKQKALADMKQALDRANEEAALQAQLVKEATDAQAAELTAAVTVSATFTELGLSEDAAPEAVAELEAAQVMFSRAPSSSRPLSSPRRRACWTSATLSAPRTCRRTRSRVRCSSPSAVILWTSSCTTRQW